MGGGVGIFVKGCLNFERIDLNLSNSTVELIGIRLKAKYTRPIDIFSLYAPPNINYENLNIIKTLRLGESLIMGDFNAHHQK